MDILLELHLFLYKLVIQNMKILIYYLQVTITIRTCFFDVNPIPKWILELPLTVIQESTYGDMDSTEIKEIFKENIKKCIESDGTVLTLVFSLGRAQEILYEFKCMQENCELDSNIPIYFDGKLAIRYTNLYIKDGLGIKPEMKDFYLKI